MKKCILFLLLFLIPVNCPASWYNCIPCIQHCLKNRSELRNHSTNHDIQSTAIAVSDLTNEIREQEIPLCYDQNGQSVQSTILVQATLVDENQEQNNRATNSNELRFSSAYQFFNIR